MDMSTIVMLMDKAAQDSKKNLNKEDQRLFREELKKAIKENGLNEENIHYLVIGMRYGSIGAYMNATRELDASTQCEYLERLLSNRKVTGLDNPSRLRMTLTLLIFNLNAAEINDVIVGELLHWLVDLSYKKDGKRLSDLSKIFNLSFVSGIDYNTKLPNLSHYHYSDEYRNELVKFFEEAIGGLTPKGDEEITKKHALRDWIKKYATVSESDGDQDKTIEENNKPNSNVDEEEKKDSIDKESNTEKKADSIKKEVQPEFKGQFAKKLFEMAKMSEVLEEELGSARAEAKKKEKEIAKLKINLENSQKNYMESSDANTKLRTLLDESVKQIDLLTKEKNELEARVNRQVSVIDVYDQDKANTKTEIQNQIATSLKKIYADYKSAETMEMTLDLGENMRDSLDDVFRKLKKLGIDIEGR